MTQSRVRADNSLLSRIDRAVFRLESALNLAAGLVIFALVCLAVWNVLARKLLGMPVPGYVDWTEQFMATFAFLGIAYCQREGGHIRMDILVARLSGRGVWIFEFLSTLFMLVITTALIYGSWYHFQRSFSFSDPWWSRDSTIDVALPLWPSKLLVPFSLSLLWLRLALQLWGYGRAIARAEAEPVAVPLVEPPAEQAMHEAEVVVEAPGDARNG
ncbi:MAG: TRAP transporter small permease [Alphaproteobacteria bacterium]|nr:MAG: TRAP transporter small permease [Alphaproteobacteria bacterium]